MGSHKPSTIFKRSVAIGGHKTSISLEKAFLDELKRLAETSGKSIDQLVSEIDESREHANLSSAVRVFLLKHVAR